MKSKNIFPVECYPLMATTLKDNCPAIIFAFPDGLASLLTHCSKIPCEVDPLCRLPHQVQHQPHKPTTTNEEETLDEISACFSLPVLQDRSFSSHPHLETSAATSQHHPHRDPPQILTISWSLPNQHSHRVSALLRLNSHALLAGYDNGDIAIVKRGKIVFRTLIGDSRVEVLTPLKFSQDGTGESSVVACVAALRNGQIVCVDLEKIKKNK